MDLNGTPEDFSPAGILRMLASDARTGAVRFSGEAPCLVYLHAGQLYFATDDGTDEALATALVRPGRLSAGNWEDAIAEAGDRPVVGELLAQQGSMDADLMASIVLSVAYDPLIALFRAGGGDFDFESDVAHWLGPARAFPVDAIVADVRRRVREADEWAREMPSLDMAVQVRRALPDHMGQVTLTREDWELVTALSSAGTIPALATEMGRGRYSTARVVHRLSRAGLVDVVTEAPANVVLPLRRPDPPPAPQEDPPSDEPWRPAAGLFGPQTPADAIAADGGADAGTWGGGSEPEAWDGRAEPGASPGPPEPATSSWSTAPEADAVVWPAEPAPEADPGGWPSEPETGHAASDPGAWPAEPEPEAGPGAWPAEPDSRAWPAEPDAERWPTDANAGTWPAEPEPARTAWSADGEPDTGAWPVEPVAWPADRENDTGAWPVEAAAEAWRDDGQPDTGAWPVEAAAEAWRDDVGNDEHPPADEPEHAAPMVLAALPAPPGWDHADRPTARPTDPPDPSTSRPAVAQPGAPVVPPLEDPVAAEEASSEVAWLEELYEHFIDEPSADAQPAKRRRNAPPPDDGATAGAAGGGPGRRLRVGRRGR